MQGAGGGGPCLALRSGPWGLRPPRGPPPWGVCAGYGQTPVGTHGLALLQHSEHEEDVAVAGLQASVVEAAVLLLVARLEGGRQHGEARRDVGPGRLELARVPQAAPLQPGHVLRELRGQRGQGRPLRAWRGAAAWTSARGQAPALTSSRSMSSGLPSGVRNWPPRDLRSGTITMK